MRAAVVRQPGQLMVGEVPEPRPGPYDALVKILACATCAGTDTRLIRGTFPEPVQYPGILGHESVGRVLETGRAVVNLAVGDLVLRPAAVYPGQKLDGLSSMWGGFAEYGLVRDALAWQQETKAQWDPNARFFASQQSIPADMNPADATLLITWRETFSWLRKLGVGPRHRVLILGSGANGIAFARFARLLGASQVILSGHGSQRLATAARLGADHLLDYREQDVALEVGRLAPEGVDFLIDAVGQPETFTRLFARLAPGGTAAMYGLPDSWAFRIDLSGTGEWCWRHIAADEASSHAEVLRLVQTSTLSARDFYSDVLPLEALATAFERVQRREAIKVVICLGRDGGGSYGWTAFWRDDRKRT